MTECCASSLSAFLLDGTLGMALAIFRFMFCLGYSRITKERNNEDTSNVGSDEPRIAEGCKECGARDRNRTSTTIAGRRSFIPAIAFATAEKRRLGSGLSRHHGLAALGAARLLHLPDESGLARDWHRPPGVCGSVPEFGQFYSERFRSGALKSSKSVASTNSATRASGLSIAAEENCATGNGASKLTGSSLMRDSSSTPFPLH